MIQESKAVMEMLTVETAGLLYGQIFLHMSEAFQEDNDLMDSLTSGLEGIQTFGPTELKEKTLVDV